MTEDERLPACLDRSKPIGVNSKVDYVFWPGSIGGDNYAIQLKAAAAGRFTSMAIHPRTFLNARDTGLTSVDMRHMAEDVGVAVQHLDIVTNWVMPERSEDRPPALARYDASLDLCFEISDIFGISRMNVIPAFYQGSIPVSVLADRFGAVCDRAIKHGVGVDIEFMPFWGVPNLATAWNIVSTAARPNGGILVDTWHFCRSSSELSLLERIPGEYFVSVQIADGPILPAVPDLYEETKTHRKFIGDGELPNADLLRRLARKGHLRHIGAEIFSNETTGLKPDAAGLRLAAGLHRVIADAGIT